jgi:2-methylisocitrate lyase-like PEP mutase family enzyme
VNKDQLVAKATAFRKLHGKLLVLPNAWDPASARVFASVGLPAIGTTSAGISYALGCPDGEVVSRGDMIAAVGRIARSVDIPVTADMESGFAADAPGVAETITATIEAGAVGVNLEDADRANGRVLYDVATAVERIRAARAAADRMGVPLFINARTDVYLLAIGDPADRLAHAVRRGNAYLEAGADCVFVPAVRDAETIGALARALKGPLNVMAGLGTPPARELEALGVARVSTGTGPIHAVMTLTRKIGEELATTGTYGYLDGAMTYPEANALMR